MYELEFKETLNNNEILLKYKDLLEKLSDDRVMCVGHKEDDRFYVMECCDEWFYHYLTKEECLELSEMFKEIAEAIE